MISVITLRVVSVFVAVFILGLQRNYGSVFTAGIELHIRGQGDHIQLVDIVEFFGLGQCSARHARQLLIHAEVVLDGDGGVGDIFVLNLCPFLGLYGLMQPV